MKRSSILRIVPWLLAIVPLGVAMIGSGFAGWPLALGWTIVLAIAWLVHPLTGADSSSRRTAGIAAIGALAILGSVGGWYLIPAVVMWLALDSAGQFAD